MYVTTVKKVVSVCLALTEVAADIFFLTSELNAIEEIKNALIKEIASKLPLNTFVKERLRFQQLKLLYNFLL